MAFNRRAEIEIGTSNKRLRHDLRAAEKEVFASGKRMTSAFGTAFKAGLGGFAAFGSVGGIAALGADVLKFEERLTRLGIQAGASDGELAAFKGTIDQVSRATGLSRNDVLGAADALVNLEGKSGFAADKMAVLARAAQATGAPVAELAGLAFSLGNAFKIQGATELEGALNAIINAGKAGAVPLGEMSIVLQQIGTNFAKVSSSGKAGAAQLAAAIQVGRRGFGSAAEVGTGIKAFTDQLESAAPALAAFGVRVMKTGKGGQKELRGIGEILDEFASSRLIKDPTMLSRIFGSSEARQFLRVLLENREAFDEFVAGAMDANDVQEDLDKFLSSNAGRMQKAIAAARSELEGMVTPERIEKFVSAVEYLVKALEYVVDNFGKIASLVAGIKIAQLAMATNQWGRAMSGLVDNASKTTGALQGGLAATNQMVGGMSKLVGGLARAASNAAGIASAFLIGYQGGTMLVEALGLFEDETKTTATADDPEAEADKARVNLETQRATVARLERERARVAGHANAKAIPGIVSEEFIAGAQANLATIDQQLRFERSQLDAAEAERAAQLIFQRNKARGTGAVDDIIREAKAGSTNEMLMRVGSGFGEGPTLEQSSIVKEFAPELLQGDRAQRGRVQARLQELLAADMAEEGRKKALADKVSGTAATDLEAIAAAVQAGIERANIQVQAAIDGQQVINTTENHMSTRRAP